MIDIHAHLLPGVDDGPASWEEALAMLRLAVADGIEAMVATSHSMPDGEYANPRAKLLPLIDELRDRARDAKLPIEVHAGAEVYLTPDIAQRVQAGELLTYGDARRYVLVEFPQAEIPTFATDALFQLQIAGMTPIIAHPERNVEVMRHPERLLELVERGVLAQVTASSFSSSGPARETADLLLTANAVHFVASDAHGATRRRPRLSQAAAYLQELLGKPEADRLLRENPQRMLAGEALNVDPPVRLPRERSAKRQGLWSRLLARR